MQTYMKYGDFRVRNYNQGTGFTFSVPAYTYCTLPVLFSNCSKVLDVCDRYYIILVITPLHLLMTMYVFIKFQLSLLLQPDDILRELAKQLPAGFHTKPDDFITSLEKEIHFKPFGEMLHSYSRTKGRLYSHVNNKHFLL